MSEVELGGLSRAVLGGGSDVIRDLGKPRSTMVRRELSFFWAGDSVNALVTESQFPITALTGRPFSDWLHLGNQLLIGGVL